MIAITKAWFSAFLKRLLQKTFFLILLSIFPIACMIVSHYGVSNQPLLAVVLYHEDDSELARETIDTLIRQSGTIHFYEAGSLQQFHTDIQNTTAECGYLFTKNYTMEYLLTGNSLKNSIHVEQSPGSILTDTINELVFASFFRIYNRELLLNYLQQPEVLKQNMNMSTVLQDASEFFQMHCQDGSTFSFDSSNPLDPSAQQKLTAQATRLKSEFLTNICRGILSVLILLACLCGGNILIKDRKSSLFLRLPIRLRPFIELLEILAPAVLMGCSGLLGILFLPASQPIYREAAGLLFYIPIACLLAYLLVKLVRTETVYRSLIPLLTLGALLFPPVFMDFSTYARIFTIPKYLFINTYYLEFFL